MVEPSFERLPGLELPLQVGGLKIRAVQTGLSEATSSICVSIMAREGLKKGKIVIFSKFHHRDVQGGERDATQPERSKFRQNKGLQMKERRDILHDISMTRRCTDILTA